MVGIEMGVLGIKGEVAHGIHSIGAKEKAAV